MLDCFLNIEDSIGTQAVEGEEDRVCRALLGVLAYGINEYGGVLRRRINADSLQ
jgi:hypothetical protein